MQRFISVFLAVACAAAPPPPVVAPSETTAPVPPPPPLVVVVPANCSHMIIDVDSTDESSLVIACFDGSNRTFFTNQHGPPLGTVDSVHRQLMISYAGHDADPSAR